MREVEKKIEVVSENEVLITRVTEEQVTLDELELRKRDMERQQEALIEESVNIKERFDNLSSDIKEIEQLITEQRSGIRTTQTTQPTEPIVLKNEENLATTNTLNTTNTTNTADAPATAEEKTQAAIATTSEETADENPEDIYEIAEPTEDAVDENNDEPSKNANANKNKNKNK